MLASGLASLGLVCVEQPDGLAITGGTPRGGARVATHLDHRIAMAFAAIGCRASEPVWFDDFASVATSYPGFLDTLAALGAGVVPDTGHEKGSA